ncbi:MAG TPA: ABC transporter ATP-binding protein [Terriglobales bacterium]|nr:ABC transporter ATP-binding protein [Terriglobales bacterium]
MAIVQVTQLARRFQSKSGTVVALDSVDLEVNEGEVFGLLGPNGAGKTTLIRILSTLLLPTSGRATILGYDVAKEPDKIRPIINMASGAERAGYEFISARGNLWFFSQLYGTPTEEFKQRVDSLSSKLELEKYIDKKVYELSTGYRQRMTIARAFINDPKVVFMDEPTIALDVMTARRIREFLAHEAKEGKRTIFLATHNMAETEAICNRVAIIDKGRILVCETPDVLKRQYGRPAYVMELRPSPPSMDPFTSVPHVKGVTSTLDEERGVATVKVVVEDDDAIDNITRKLETSGIKLLSSRRQEPTLEEVFVTLVGRGFTERESESAA